MKYVAIGDSISAGFISNNPHDLPGELIVKNNKKKVTGLSFPAFISEYVNKMDGDFLSSFKNYAATGTRVDNWIDLIHGVDNKENEKIFGENIDEFRNNFLRDLVAADHITITLGANEFIKTVFEVASSYNINKLIDKNLKIVESEYTKFKKAIVVSFNNQYNVLFKKLITKIKKTNINAKVYMVSYTSPFRDADDDAKTKIKSTFGNLKPIGDFVFEINKYIKKNCDKYEIEYVDIENNKLWKENSEWTYSKIDMSHPNITGYKTIGQIVLESMLKDESNEFKKSFNKYKKTFKYQVRYKTELEIVHDGTIVKENISNRLVTLAGTYAELSILFIKGFLTTTFAEKTIPVEKIRDFLFRNDDKNFTLIFAELVKNRTLVRMFNYFQTGMAMKEDDAIDDVMKEFTITEGAEYSLLSLMINIINIKEFQDKEIKRELVFICLSALDKISNKDNEKLMKSLISNIVKSVDANITLEMEDYIFTIWKIFASSNNGSGMLEITIWEVMNNPEKYMMFNTFESFVLKVLFNIRDNNNFNAFVMGFLQEILANDELKAMLTKILIGLLVEHKIISKGSNNKIQTVITKIMGVVFNNFDDFSIWKDMVRLNNELNLLANTKSGITKVLPEVVSLLLFKKDNQNLYFKKDFMLFMLNVLKDINNFSKQESNALYDVLTTIVSKFKLDKDVLEKMKRNAQKNEMIFNFKNVKRVLLLVKLKKAYSKHLKIISNVTSTDGQSKYESIINHEYIFIIIGILSLPNNAGKTTSKNLDTVMTKLIKKWFGKKISNTKQNNDTFNKLSDDASKIVNDDDVSNTYENKVIELFALISKK